MTTKKLRVTDEHIRNGKRARCYQCPIALAASEHFSTRCSFDGRWLEVIRGGRCVESYDMPESAHQFAIAFDDALMVEPCEFELPEPTDMGDDHDNDIYHFAHDGEL